MSNLPHPSTNFESKLPKGWITAKVEDLFIIKGGGTPSTNEEKYWNGDIPWITSADIYGLTDIRPRKKISKVGIKNSATNLVPEGSIIVVTRVSLGRIAKTQYPICFSQDSQALIPKSKDFSGNYFLYFLSTAVQAFKQNSRGTTISGVTKKQLADLQIPLPSLAEQRRIVAKIEELFTQLDAAKAALLRAQANLKRYHQSVLQAAVIGDLTKEWRKKNYIDLISWQQMKLMDACEQVEKVNPRGNPKSKFFYVDIASIDNTKQQIIKPKEYFGKDAPSRARQLVKTGDILFSTVRTYLKNISLVPESLNNQIASTGFCVVRPNQKILSKFLFTIINTEKFINILSGLQRGTSYPAVRDSDVFDQMILLPSIEEQKEIIVQVDIYISQYDKFEQLFSISLNRIDFLRQSILQRAFTGKLVSQESGYS